MINSNALLRAEIFRFAHGCLRHFFGGFQQLQIGQVAAAVDNSNHLDHKTLRRVMDPLPAEKQDLSSRDNAAVAGGNLVFVGTPYRPKSNRKRHREIERQSLHLADDIKPAGIARTARQKAASRIRPSYRGSLVNQSDR
nr:hypothetical protein [Mesorhizobium loti]